MSAGAALRLRDGSSVTLRSIDAEQDGAVRGDEADAITAEAGGRVVGSASYVRVYGPRALLSIDVDRAFWHRGLPELLIGELADRAAPLGIATFLARVRASDVMLLALLRSACGACQTRDGDLVDVEFATAGRSRSAV